ncbi:MAG TPA: hypothetical protein DGT21_20005 [Armatimonadetes bacterium]|jgi:hypothetical protein|nr:hypothetical protein [Armatimonadota bacterium]
MRAFCCIVLLATVGAATALPERPIVGDYNSELRIAGGQHVDCPRLVKRLTELGVNTYMWLIWHNANDWEDLHAFLPMAAEAGIEVWVYLVPHSETALTNPQWPYSEPFRLDYIRWAREIALLSLQYPNLVGYVIDDFWYNFDVADRFSIEYTRQMVEAGRAVNPALKFYPLMYYRQIGLPFSEKLAPLIDGVVAAYPRDREEIEQALAYLDDIYVVPAAIEVSFPTATPSTAGDRGMLRRLVRVTDAATASISLNFADDYDGVTEGYHLLQVRIDDELVWSEDAGGHDASRVTIDLSAAVAGREQVTLSVGVYEQKGVAHYGLHARFSDFSISGLDAGPGEFLAAEAWRQDVEGSFVTSVTPEVRGAGAYSLPLIVMPAGQRSEYRNRWGVEPTAEMLAAKMRMILDLAAEGRIEGVVTYCLDKSDGSEDFEALSKVYLEFWAE